MKKQKPLNYKFFRQKLPVSQLPFETTRELKTSTIKFIGQERAEEAILFGIGVTHHGYNLYAMGPAGIGKRRLVKTLLTKQAQKCETPSDWCYIYNFDLPEKPIALELPPGSGIMLQQDMNTFISEISSSLLTVFESKAYRSHMKKIAKYFDTKRQKVTDDTPKFYKEQYEKEKKLKVASINTVVKPLISKLKHKYAKFPGVIQFLSAVQNDIFDHIDDLIKHDEKTNLLTFSLENPVLTKYKINLLVDNSQLKGAPIVFEEAPSYSTLICRIEHTSQLGLLATNFTLIKSGSLHRANGGYLIIQARKLKKNSEAWEALKSALYAKEIIIKPIDSDSIKPISLEPMPIPLNVKVILLGDRNTYYNLSQEDPDFRELFKVAADFDDQIDRDKKNIQSYARLIGSLVERNKLQPFHATAIAEIIDYSSRLAEDVEKLSTHIREIEDLVIESNYWAEQARKKIVKGEHVKQAIDAQIHRMDRARDLYYEDIYRDFIKIDTTGECVGQINCLSVRRVGNFAYGHPTRVTATIRVGQGKVIDIQREIKLSGPMHNKAGLIISNFLASRFSVNQPFSLHASLAFEQIYVWTDGDSASVGELCALLSALADIPIYQFFAVTGSIDQHGCVQAVGGINEKVEGFFDVCKAKGLDGKQGVLIPQVNVKNLMLREDVQAAAKEEQFFIYPIETIDDAISLLTGLDASIIYSKIENRLKLFAKSRKKNTK